MIVGVDTGGTKTLVARFSSSGQIEQQKQFLTAPDPDQYLAEVVAAIQEVTADQPLEGLAVGVPGIVKDGVFIWGGNLPWQQFELKRRLSEHFSCPISIENDANLAGLSEANVLKPIPLCCLYLTISTGIGSGIILNGQLHPGLSASEPGHMVLNFDGEDKEWEDVASGRAIRETYGAFARDITDPAIWDKQADLLSRGLLVLIPALQPEVIVLGGSIGNYYERFEGTLNDILAKQLPSGILRPEIRQAAHPEEAVIYGCYYYALDNLSH